MLAELTGLRYDYPQQLASCEAKTGLKRRVPCSCDWATLQNPQQGENNVGDDEKNDCALKRSYQSLCCWNAHQEEANRDFGPHQGGKCLNPLAIGILPKFEKLVLI